MRFYERNSNGKLEKKGECSMGNHLESRFMLGEYMIHSVYTEVVIDDIILSLLEDTQFYKID